MPSPEEELAVVTSSSAWESLHFLKCSLKLVFGKGFTF